MLTLVIGGSGSGKSAAAERLLDEISDAADKYYLATMKVFDEEGARKVKRHRMFRQGKGFRTIEQPESIERAGEAMRSENSAVLLECMSNLTANEMFGERTRLWEETAEKIWNGLESLSAKTKHLIVVTGNVFEDGIQYDEGTMEYIKALAELNLRIAKKADTVIEVTAGCPVVLKGAEQT